MSIKELFSRFTAKSQIKSIISKIFDKTITEDEIAELIVNKRIFKWYKGKQLIDYILENNIHSNILNSLATTDLNFAMHYFKHKRFDILGEANSDILLAPVEEVTILDYVYREFLNNQNIPDEEKGKAWDNIRFHIDNDEIIKIAYRNNDFVTVLSNESFLLSPSSSNDNESNLEAVIRKLLERDSIKDLSLIVYSVNTLTYRSRLLNGKSILEYLIETLNCKLDWDKLDDKILLHMVDNDNPNITILDYLIQQDRQQVIDALDEKYDNFIENTRILQILRLNNITLGNGYEPIRLKINLEAKHADEYHQEPYKKDFNRSHQGNSIDYLKQKIEEFKRLMLRDGKSDEEIVNLACNAFIRAFTNNDPYALRDLQYFINVKRRFGSFRLKKIHNLGERSYSTSPMEGHILTEENTPDIISFNINNPYNLVVFNHELGHTLHHFSNSFSVPNEFYQLSRLDENKIKKMLDYYYKFMSEYEDFKSSLMYRNTNKLTSESTQAYAQKKDYYFNKYHERVMADLDNAAKDEKYSPEYLEYLREQILSEEEFKEHFDANARLFGQNAYFEHYKLSKGLLFGIFDALSCGVFSSLGFEEDGTLNKRISGHDIEYYLQSNRKQNVQFEEILANYIAITKLPDSEYLIGILTDIMGIEFVNMLQEYYDNMHIEYNMIGNLKKPPKGKK